MASRKELILHSRRVNIFNSSDHTKIILRAFSLENYNLPRFLNRIKYLSLSRRNVSTDPYGKRRIGNSAFNSPSQHRRRDRHDHLSHQQICYWHPQQCIPFQDCLDLHCLSKVNLLRGVELDGVLQGLFSPGQEFQLLSESIWTSPDGWWKPRASPIRSIEVNSSISYIPQVTAYQAELEQDLVW